MTLNAIVDAQIGDILNDDGTFRPVKDWDPVFQRMCSSYKVVPIFERSGDGKDRSWDLVGYSHEVKLERGNKAIELLGRHNEVKAFPVPGRGELTVNVTLETIEAKLYLA